MITLSRSIYRLGQSVCGFSNCKFSVFSIVNARSPSQNQWIQRQTNDFFTREAKLRQYKSRAAFKLLEIDKKYKLFKSGMTVVDLGFAPGAWSQVAVEKTSPNGKIVGVDILFATPPEGVTAIQGNFLTKSVQDEVHRLVCDPHLGRRIPKGKILISDEEDVQQQQREVEMGNDSNDETEQSIDGEEIHRRDLELNMARTAIDLEKETVQKSDNTVADDDKESSPLDKYNVDVVLSDMCAPIFQNSGFWLRSVNDPFVRMANTSGLAVRDHGASIVSEKDLAASYEVRPGYYRVLKLTQDLCDAALIFAINNLKPGGKFVCKYFTGPEDKFLKKRLDKVFRKVYREKPNSSRKESREMYFIGIGKTKNITKERVYRHC